MDLSRRKGMRALWSCEPILCVACDPKGLHARAKKTGSGLPEHGIHQYQTDKTLPAVLASAWEPQCADPACPQRQLLCTCAPQQERTVRWVVISVREVSEHRQASAFHEQYAKQKHPQVQAVGVDRNYGRFNFSKRVFMI